MDFCRTEGVSSSNFYLWRSRLAVPVAPVVKVPVVRAVQVVKAPVVRADRESVAAVRGGFVDLGACGHAASAGRLELRLDLGDGLVLTLVRG